MNVSQGIVKLSHIYIAIAAGQFSPTLLHVVNLNEDAKLVQDVIT